MTQFTQQEEEWIWLASVVPVEIASDFSRLHWKRQVWFARSGMLLWMMLGTDGIGAVVSRLVYRHNHRRFAAATAMLMLVFMMMVAMMMLMPTLMLMAAAAAAVAAAASLAK